MRLQITTAGNASSFTAAADDAAGESGGATGADAAPVTEGAAPGLLPSPYGRFRALLTVEDEWSRDHRTFGAGALRWEALPLPMQGTTDTSMEHLGAVNIGAIDSIERTGGEVWGSGPWAATAEANEIRLAVREQRVRGVSVDVGDYEWQLVIPPEMEAEQKAFEEEIDAMIEGEDPPEREEQRDDEGNLVIDMFEPGMRVTDGEVLGATVVPFPAFREGQIFDEDPTFELVNVVPGEAPDPALVAAAAATAVTIPVAPPLDWFVRPSFSAYTPWTVTDEGQVFGHVASWSACHIAFPDYCQTAPHSASDYAHFLHGEVRCADGTRVPVGQITANTGHADTDLDAWDAIRHYDHTGLAIADVFCGEDDYGIWIAGALRPGVSPEQVRASMAAGVSGDWRWIAGTLELVAVLNVNVPGFNDVNPRVRGMVASGVARSLIVPLAGPRAAGTDPATARRLRSLMASAVGRTPNQRRAEMRALVHPEA